MNMLPKKFYLDSIFDNLLDGTNPMDMKCDIYEKNGSYHIEADIPGFDKKDIALEYNNGYLTITAEKEEVKDDETKNYIKKERSYGKVERQFYIGDIDEEHIKAEFNDGILKIAVPKVEKANKLIEIK